MFMANYFQNDEEFVFGEGDRLPSGLLWQKEYVPTGTADRWDELTDVKIKRTDEHGSQKDDPLEQLGNVCRSFIYDHIRFIDYLDIAHLLGIKSETLKDVMEQKGLKLPIESARKWENVELGQYKSPDQCARCQVQRKHNTFFVGLKNCRKCYEKNIKHWVALGERVKLIFPHEL